MFKCGTPERLTALEFSADGLFVFGGGASGKLYAWEVRILLQVSCSRSRSVSHQSLLCCLQANTGLLMKVWDAHYKSVTVLRLSADASVMVSASEDSVIHVWDVGSALATEHHHQHSDTPSSSPSPMYTLSEHTLPVTDVCLSSGVGLSLLMLSVSLDRSLKVRDLLHASCCSGC